jgi:hypothetical protein
VEGLPYIAYGLSLWAFATLIIVAVTTLATGQDNPRRANKLIIVFGITTLDLVEIVGFGLILALYLIPVSFSLKLFLRAVDASGVLKDC